MELTEICGVVLPIHASFYGEIATGDLAWFLSVAQKALENCGFRFIKKISNGESEQELWGNSDQLTTQGNPPEVINTETGDEVGLKVEWPEIAHLFTVEAIQGVIEEAYRNDYEMKLPA